MTILKRSIRTRAMIAIAAGLALGGGALSAAPAMAASTVLSGGITGSGSIYHTTPRYNSAGPLSLSNIWTNASCGGSATISLRLTAATTAFASNKISMHAGSASFITAVAGVANFGAGNKFFTSSASGSMETCHSDWSANYNTP